MKGYSMIVAFFVLMTSACQPSDNDESQPADQTVQSPAQEVSERQDETHEQTEEAKHHNEQVLESIAQAANADNNDSDSASSKAIQAQTNPEADIFLSTAPAAQAHQGSFNCEDTIFMVIKFKHHQPKLHQIQIDWLDPNDQAREKNDFPFFVTEQESIAWASLKLHRSVGAGLLQWVNPAAGMEEFIGVWTVNVKVSNIVKQTLNFEVLC